MKKQTIKDNSLLQLKKYVQGKIMKTPLQKVNVVPSIAHTFKPTNPPSVITPFPANKMYALLLLLVTLDRRIH